MVYKHSCGLPESLSYSVWSGLGICSLAGVTLSMSLIQARDRILLWFKAQALRPDSLGLSLTVVTYHPCDLGRRTSSPHVSVFPLLKWGQ